MFMETTAPSAPKITRGTVDFGNLKHYLWESPSGKTFDLLFDTEVQGGTLIIKEGHIMPQSGTFAESQGTLGLKGLRQLQKDLGQIHGVDTIVLPNQIPRPTSKVGDFGLGTYPIPKE
jgi:hypothetical protein